MRRIDFESRVVALVMNDLIGDIHRSLIVTANLYRRIYRNGIIPLQQLRYQRFMPAECLKLTIHPVNGDDFSLSDEKAHQPAADKGGGFNTQHTSEKQCSSPGRK